MPFLALAEACDKNTYEYIRSHKHTTPILGGIVNPRGRAPGTASPPTSQPEEEEESGSDEDSDDDTIKLTFRSGVTKDITFRVRQTTKCSVILNAYLEKAGLAGK